MYTHFFALALILIPLMGFLINIFFGNKLGKTLSGIIGTLSVALAFGISIMFFLQIQTTKQSLNFNLFNWISLNHTTIKFGFLLDQLSILWLMIVTGIGSLINLYSISYMHNDDNNHKFFAYLNLFIFFMITLVIGSNLLIMFIGWEGVGLCSYLLIGFWHKNQEYNDAAKKAFIMNRIGDLGLLLGIFMLLIAYGTCDFTTLKTIFTNANFTTTTPIIFWSSLFLFIGACGKSAQIPLYTWLPDAMAGPTPVSALIHAATMVTAGIFMITRLNFLFDLAPEVLNIIAIIGAITAIVAASIGLVQNDIKKVLAYSTVSQLGLIFVALGCGAYKVAVFHVITHAFFKACLFLGSGSVIHALQGEQDMRKMGGLRKIMPITFITMFISTLAIVGIFPFAGFWSKDEILLVAFEHNKFLWILSSITSIMTAFYMFRLLFLTFFKEFRGTAYQKNHLHESTILITLPLIILAILATIGGLISLPGNSWLGQYLAPIFNTIYHENTLGMHEYIFMTIALLGAFAGIIYAYILFIKQNNIPVHDSQIQGLSKILYNKYFIDEIYNTLLIKPVNLFSKFCRNHLETSLSVTIFGLGTIANGLGTQGKKLQNGSIGLYLFAFVIGFCIILFCIFL